MKDTKETKNEGPEKKFKAGSITATIWKAKQEGSKTLLTVFEKSYKNKEDEWQTTNHFTARDLPVVSWLAKQAFEFVTDKEK
ncbi:hypothetical protein HQ545_00475 [Candidatus Woesearchaeota archaeon]|nr:hypothetical protein [Candidatus Woesearchaeota archaeon]